MLDLASAAPRAKGRTSHRRFESGSLDCRLAASPNRLRRVDRLSRFAPLSGLITAVLFGIGSALWGFEQPSQDAGSDEIVSFYEDTSTEILIGGTMSIISLLFLVWFGAVLHERLAAAEGSEGSGLPLVSFAGTVLLAAVGLGAETINMAGAISADDGQLTAETAQIYFDVSWAFGAPAAGVAIAMAATPVALIALRTGRLLPSWAAWLTLLIALSSLTPLMWTAAFQYPFALAVLLLAALSARLFRQGSQSIDEQPV